MTNVLPAPEPLEKAPLKRLVSLDALRGFDMFWILGADEVAYALRRMEPSPVTRLIAGQLDHVEWAGLHFYDLIFPLFVFIVGVALVFSLSRSVTQRGRAATLRHIFVRAGVLFLLGIVYNGGLSSSWPDVRLLGVLQRIAIAYAAAGTLFIFCKSWQLVAIGGAILAGYWALLTFVPIRAIQLTPASLAAQLGADAAHAAETAEEAAHGRPSAPYWAQVRERFDATTERVTGRYEPGLNLANHLDFRYVPGRMYDVYWDPEGLLSMLPAVVTCLFGVLAGLVLGGAGDDEEKMRKLLLMAGGALVLGYAWSLQFPVIKKIWTSSFVLVAGGWSTLLLAGFYQVVDVLGWRRWCTPFVWIGMNPITLYLATAVVGFHGIARRLVGGSVQGALDRQVTGLGGLLVAAVSLGLIVMLARFLYRRGIFLKV